MPEQADKPGKHWVGFDLGGTKMLAAVFDSKLHVVGRKKKRVRSGDSAKEGLGRILETIEEAIAAAGIDRASIGGVGIGCPGPIDGKKGVMRYAPNLGWRDVDVVKPLSDALHCPGFILNDVDAGVYGEYTAGAAKGVRCVVGIFPGTGVGGGCVYEGQILGGGRISAMEIGHMRISSSDRLGGTDMTGTLESEASRLSIAAECGRLAYRGAAPQLHKAAGVDIAAIRSKTIFEAIDKGDTQVQRVVDNAIEQLGYAAVNMVHLLAPEVIVLGGGLVEARPAAFVSGVQKVIDRAVMECYLGLTKVVAAELGDDATVLGAAAWSRRQVEPILAEPKVTA